MIDIKEKVVLGGLPQKIHIRGAEESLPVLLCMHGGPGVTNRHSIMQCKELTDSFLTIAWDQRGTAGSYWGARAEDLTIAQMVSDANELVEFLRKRFNREKIFVMGGSWGSLLGTCLLKDHPEHIYAFVGFGQVVNIEKNEQIFQRPIRSSMLQSLYLMADWTITLRRNWWKTGSKESKPL